MSHCTLDFKVKDIELVAYDIGSYFTKQGYACKVFPEGVGFTTLIFKQRFFKNIIGTPTAVRIHFTEELGSTNIEVGVAKVKINAQDVLKSTLSIVTILPQVNKIIQYQKLLKEVKKQTLIITNKHRIGEQKI